MEEKTLDSNRLYVKSYITQMADEVIRIWKRAPVPTRCRYHVIEMARLLWAKGDSICKSWESKVPDGCRSCCSDDTSDGIDG